MNTWEIIRIPSASSQANEELNELREYTSTLGKTKPGPSFISSGLVSLYPSSPSSFPRNVLFIYANHALSTSWITRLHETFKENGLENIVVDRHKFSQEIVTLLLDTWMMASHEISVNVLDQLGGGQGDMARGLIEEVGKNRQNTAFNLQRVITVGQKPAA